ncbi:MAG: outer membrane protein assembly factor BamE [Nitrospinaceae bacterium]|nr:outer membrane protein assembly factor BamE [Nitrospinaceae bacterium]NIR53255.1 outer membrane protein assembly factor BamE [Nitrospinaceae bacterium]NIS83653.1 outer membrane protein assembly factor BamE [Nitrospinaceae bacterium]NIT80442.1 outer membrane protein assembly factor BamE [Nitrospinaceae bacterium]NIU42780.1 outer membrane protein assembly factor BamE [Nitrospinaceae bacterium]
MNKFLIYGVMFFCLSWMVGCGTHGQDFDIDQAQSIEKGKTTKDDIVTMFGEPFKTGVQNGHPIWVYETNKWKAVGKDTDKSLIVEFDDQGVVRSHQIMSNEPAP